MCLQISSIISTLYYINNIGKNKQANDATILHYPAIRF